MKITITALDVGRTIDLDQLQDSISMKTLSDVTKEMLDIKSALQPFQSPRLEVRTSSPAAPKRKAGRPKKNASAKKTAAHRRAPANGHVPYENGMVAQSDEG